jgi:hypothetical protein
MSNAFQDKWVDERREQTLAILDGIFETARYVRALPASGAEAHKLVAVDGIDAILPIVMQLVPADLSRDQAYAAMLIGRGLTVSEAGQALDLPEAQALVHLWMGKVSFRRLVRYWRRTTMEDQLALVWRELDEMESRGPSDGVLLKIARLRYEISQAPADRDLAEAALQLKLREVQAREKEVDHQTGDKIARPPWLDDIRDFASGQMLDAEFDEADGSFVVRGEDGEEEEAVDAL